MNGPAPEGLRETPADELTHEDYRDLTFAPCRLRPGAARADFGVFDAQMRPVAAFDHPFASHRAIADVPVGAGGDAIYGGMLMDHFGHFLIEAMSRLWFLRAHPERPVIWHQIALPIPHTPWPGWRDEVWRLLGLHKSQHHVIRAPLRLAQVTLPQSGVTNIGAVHPRQAAALACVRASGKRANARVWLSRTGLPARFGGIEGEAAVEQRLGSEGWLVVRPETLSVREQAEAFAEADVIAGFTGSAFHAVLLTIAPRARLILLDRPSVNRAYYENIAASLGLRQDYLAGKMEPLGPLHAWTHFRLVDPAETASLVLRTARA